ncbi:WbqC family protein, partial [Bacillus velezensis]|uniref:WbqC family protein n=1 Tax=Bacillus velezensis TaxID=492670 RepID=UPI0011A3F702
YKSDVFAIDERGEFEKKGLVNGKRMKRGEGGRWVRVGLEMKEYKDIEVGDMKMEEREDWGKKDWMGIKMKYGKGGYFEG